MGVERATAPIRFASYLSDNAAEFYRAVVAYVSGTTGLPAEMATAIPGGLGDSLANGQTDAAFCCGLPYVLAGGPEIAQVLAALVLMGERYGHQPVYFSDFIVRANAGVQVFEDLRGATWAYNEQASLSGYVLPVHWLLSRGEGPSFFGRCLAAGAHTTAIDWVERGLADTAAIDSMVLAMELRQHPERARRLRIVASAGPAPMPPVVAAGRLPSETMQRLRAALCAMHKAPAGQAILSEAGVERFAPVVDADYDAIRNMWQAVRQAGLGDFA